ncbi:MAG: hypothetical protein IT317_03905 [Anaerolineales bacterium]|nr:hypothetical protein [Anaerolineales bacterium]
MPGEAERMQILQMIEDGQVSAAEGLRLLDALNSAPAAEAAAPAPEAARPAPAALPAEDLNRWRRWWIVPMWIGAGIVLLGALLMYAALATTGQMGFWFGCATLPFIVGVLVMALAGFSQSARWLHVRVKTGQAEWPRNIAISFPLPIGLTAWFLRAFGHLIPKLRETGVDELIMALGEHTSADAPLYINVDEGSGGEKVQVYIG